MRRKLIRFLLYLLNLVDASLVHIVVPKDEVWIETLSQIRKADLFRAKNDFKRRWVSKRLEQKFPDKPARDLQLLIEAAIQDLH